MDEGARLYLQAVDGADSDVGGEGYLCPVGDGDKNQPRLGGESNN